MRWSDEIVGRIRRERLWLHAVWLFLRHGAPDDSITWLIVHRRWATLDAIDDHLQRDWEERHERRD